MTQTSIPDKDLVLTEEQKNLITQLQDELGTYLWEQTYYNDPNKKVTSLFKEGVELNFEVTLKPYVGYNHPLGEEHWGE